MSKFNKQYQQNISMQGHSDADNSINEILEMLKNYKPDLNKSRDFEELSMDSGDWLASTKRNQQAIQSLPRFTQPNHLQSKKPQNTYKFDRPSSNYNSNKFDKTSKSNANQKLDRTFQKVVKSDLKSKPSQLTNINTTATTSTHNQSKTVFTRLFQQKKQQQHRRNMLLYQTRRSIEAKQSKECTFSPHIIRQNRLRTSLDPNEAQEFYHRNLDWLERREKSIKLKQCERDTENIDKFTFTPKINKLQNRINDKENAVVGKKGVEQFLSRQSKAKKMTQYVQTRKKNPYSHVWNIKQGYFSYAR